MSTIIAVKEKDRVYFGFDMAGFSMFSPLDITLKDNYPVFSLPEVPNSILGIAEKGPVANIIKTSYTSLIGELELIHKEVDFSFVVRRFVPRMKEMLTGYTSLRKDATQTFLPQCLFAFEDNLYEIEPNGFVMVVEDATIINDNYNQHYVDGAEGYLANSFGENARNRIINAFKAGVNVNFSHSNKIVIVNNIDLKYEIIDLDENRQEKNICKNESITQKCVLCGDEFIGMGYDVKPIMNEGLCCKRCYEKFVVPANKKD